MGMTTTCLQNKTGFHCTCKTAKRPSCKAGCALFQCVLASCVAVLPLLLFSAPVWATDYAVTNLNDSGPGSLRQAITDANDTDKIVFDPELSGTISLASPLPDLDSVTFENAGTVTLFLDNAEAYTGTLNVGDGKTISGLLPGEVRIEGTKEIHSIFSTGSMTLNGDMSGSIAATATDRYALGLFSGLDMTLNGDMSGSVAATACDSTATGLFSGNDMTLNGYLSGSVTAKGSGGAIYGVQADQHMVFTGDLSGSVAATAGGNWATGLYASQTITLENGLSGSVTATAVGTYAYGFKADLRMTLNGILSGSVTATAGGDDAFGLGAELG